jgi:hypothetical protein
MDSAPRQENTNLARRVTGVKKKAENLCGPLPLAGMRRAKSKIPMVAVVASVRAYLKDRTNDFFNRALFPGPAHQMAMAPGTDVLSAKLDEAHRNP